MNYIHNTLINSKLLEEDLLFIICIGAKGHISMQYIHIRINELLEERMISKNRICKDLDLPRGNFNRYCRDDFQRIDANLIIKLCNYFGCSIADLLEMREE